MNLHVESHSALHGDREPHAFLLGGRRIDIVAVIDRWIAHDHSYYKVEGSDRCLYILRYAPSMREWELTLFQAIPP